jgi:hypothetical protein
MWLATCGTLAALSSVAIPTGAAAASLTAFTASAAQSSVALSSAAAPATLALSAAHEIVIDSFVSYVHTQGKQVAAQLTAAAATGTAAARGAGARAAAAKAAARRAALARATALRLAVARQGAAREQAVAQQAVAQPAASQGPTPPPASGANLTSVATPAGSPQQIAMTLLAGYGWGGQFSCLDSLWNRESGWNPYAQNPSSGAYGIPQALPGAKMASAGPDWQTDAATQIRWGLGYIRSVYGTPCGAWSHEEAVGWY